jgi:isopenicillin N synthase-like dioxygenase
MMRIFALALDLPEGHFDSMVHNPGVTSRMMHYPPQPVKEEVREGLGAHTVSWSGGNIRRTSF